MDARVCLAVESMLDELSVEVVLLSEIMSEADPSPGRLLIRAGGVWQRQQRSIHPSIGARRRQRPAVTFGLGFALVLIPSMFPVPVRQTF